MRFSGDVIPVDHFVLLCTFSLRADRFAMSVTVSKWVSGESAEIHGTSGLPCAPELYAFQLQRAQDRPSGALAGFWLEVRLLCVASSSAMGACMSLLCSQTRVTDAMSMRIDVWFSETPMSGAADAVFP